MGASGTPHMQGFINCNKPYNIPELKQQLGDRYHFERARGTDKDNRTYCSKDGKYFEHGRLTGTSSRSNPSAVSEDFIRHMDQRGELREFMELHPTEWIRMGSTMLRNYLSTKSPEERPNISVKWIYGPPGIGKSRYAHQQYAGAYIKESRSIWWNNYKLEKEVIIDDFGPKSIDINHLLKWFDRYKCFVQTKGGMLPLLADKFIVTSNYSPEECFRLDDGRDHPQLEALLRRVDVTHMV